MGKKYDFDYIVIGSGPAGSAAATSLAKAKKSVALVEGRFWGGANLNTRDVPYSVALDFSHTSKKASSLPEFRNQDFTFSLPTAISHQNKVTLACDGNNYQVFKKSGVTCISGFANFLDANTIAVNSKKYTAHYFIIATGAKLKTLEISGTGSVKYLTPETAIKIRRSPRVAVIVGGGSTGCEIASYYAELGIKVVILETSSRLLPREDKEVGELLTKYFTDELGIMVLTNSKVVALEQEGAIKKVIFTSGRSEKMIRTDCVVLATGSQPNLDLGLENAGVKYKNSGIIVDRYFETSARNIFAVGDCLGKDSSTELADYEGALLAANLINKTKNPADYHGFTRVTNTSPAIVTIGYNEDDLLRRDRKYKVALIPFSQITAGNIYESHYGFVKLISDKSNRIIGATIMSPYAELLAPELSLAIRHNLTTVEIASTPHTINTYGYAIKLAAKKLLFTK